MKIPNRCSDYTNAVKSFLISQYLPFNELRFYINDNIFDNLWEDFKDDKNLLDLLLILKKMLSKNEIILPPRFTTDCEWVTDPALHYPITIDNRSSYLKFRDLLSQKGE